MKYLLGLICSVALFIACSDDDKEKTVKLDKRTVIVYVSAENNLNSYMESDLSEMADGSLNIGSGNNLVAFVDGADKNQLPYIVSFKNGQRVLETDYKAVSDFYASDPNMMHEAICWIMNKYPSESYGLVLWGHASGWLITNDSVAYKNKKAPAMKKAYGGDNGNNSTAGSGKVWMNIPTMAKVLERLPYKLDFIFADCCNIMSTEVAYELRNATDYLLGSPAEIPGNGAPYNTLVPQLFNTSADFYKGVLDSYYAAYDNHVVLSAVKTSEMENLAMATKAIMPELTDGEIDTDGLIYYYGGSANKVMFDVKGLVKKNVSEASFAQWNEALDRAVVYKKMGAEWDTMGYVSFNDFTMTDDIYGGMSMFMPMDIYNKYGNSYNYDITKMEWHYAAGMNK